MRLERRNLPRRESQKTRQQRHCHRSEPGAEAPPGTDHALSESWNTAQTVSNGMARAQTSKRAISGM
jgi:hypothetical protein